MSDKDQQPEPQQQQPVPQAGYAQPGQPSYGAPPPGQQGYGPPPQGQPGYGPPPPSQPGYGPPQQYANPHGGQAPPPGYYQQPPQGYPQPQQGFAGQQGMYAGGGGMQGAYMQSGPGGQPIGMAPQGGQAPQVQWMQRPETIPGCPPGLEYLTMIDQILIHQQVELFEAFTNFETQNRYQIKNSLGQQIYFAHEESDTCHRQCCGPQRAFQMHITDNMQNEVIKVSREFKCCAGCNCCAFSDCCAMMIEIEAPVGQVVGYVKQKCSCLAPKFEILDAQQQTVLAIDGPTCICQGPCCTRDQEFQVSSADGAHEVGKISKQWSGLIKEYFTKADNFGVSFPMDLDVKMKAVMIGAVFLIDFMFFEQKQNNNQNHHHHH